jgi:Winged helix DNA-binding domain
VRLIAEFDNLLLSHADRSHLFEPRHRARIMTANGIVAGTVLIDGFVGGTWKLVSGGGVTTVRVQPFSTLSEGDEVAIGYEACRLLEFSAVEPAAGRIDLLPPAEPVS